MKIHWVRILGSAKGPLVSSSLAEQGKRIVRPSMAGIRGDARLGELNKCPKEQVNGQARVDMRRKCTSKDAFESRRERVALYEICALNGATTSHCRWTRGNCSCDIMSTGAMIHKQIHAPTCRCHGQPSHPRLRRRPAPAPGKRYAPGETAIPHKDTFSSPGGAKYAPGCRAEASHGQLQTAVCAAVYLVDRWCCQYRDCGRGSTHLPFISPAVDFCGDRGILAGTDALMSSRASKVS